MKKFDFSYCMKHDCNSCKRSRECDSKKRKKEVRVIGRNSRKRNE